MAPDHISPLRLGPYGWEANPDYLLFDDLVLLPQLQAEHAVLRRLVAAFTGDRNCLDVRELLGQVLALPAARSEILAEVLELEGQLGLSGPRLHHARTVLADLPAADLCQALVSGADPDTGARWLSYPAPNLLFARDLLAVVGKSVVLGWPRSRARKRDGILARAVARHHPWFRGADRIDLRADRPGLSPAELDDERCLEGGDVLVLRHDLVLVGIGQRTTLPAALRLAAQLRDRGVRHVLGVVLPVARATMHLDTVVTMIDQSLVLAFPPALGGAAGDLDAVGLVDLLAEGCPIAGSLTAALAERGLAVTVVPCGDGDARAALREQWSDGANAFCLVPGGIVLYGRNTATLRALNRQGFSVLAPDFVVDNAEMLARSGERFVVALPGSELSRGRGGPRCLTLPLARDDAGLPGFDADAPSA
ncbi:MAG: hypothetical protein FJ100_10885 [Deltaproteobacteria bacterium]|nr:hypothetical protein [Deltaproteobacteria bacterium]